MANIMEIMQLCRLCLVKDQVNIPIFEEQGDIRQIFLKISACLPVKVSREDDLPKKICDGCSYKLEMLYQFWNTSANSEKQLLKWLSQVGIDKVPTSDKKATTQQSHSINTDGVILKQEVIDLGETHADEEIPTDDLNVPTDPEYLLQQQSYQSFEFQQDGFNEGEAATSSAAGPSSTVTSETAAAAPKRKRRAAAMKPLPPQIDSEDEDDVGLVETKIAKVAVIMGIAGALRCQELLHLSLDNIQDEGTTLFINVKDTKTNNDKFFRILNPNFIKLYRKYASLRPSHTNHRRFFIYYKNGKCSTQVVGKNTLGKVPATMAAYLKLPDHTLYTGHSLRRSSSTLLADSGFGRIKRHGDWKSRNVAEVI